MPLALPILGTAATGAITALIALLVKAVPYILGRGLVFLGIGFATVTGVQAGFDQLVTLLHGQFNNLPAAVLQVLNMAGIPTALSFILSALAFKLSLKLVNGAMSFFTKSPSTPIG